MARSAFPVAVMAALLLATIILSSAVPARAGPPKVSISSVTYMGSGCSWENTQYVLSPDYSTVTFLFGGMIATTDSGLAGKRKNCQVSLGLDYPNGWSVSFGKVTGRGYADIAAKSSGTYQTSYYFSGQTGTARVQRTIATKYTGNYEFTDNFATLVWSQCNSAPNLNINTEVRADGTKAVMALDSSDQKFKLVFYCNWKSC